MALFLSDAPLWGLLKMGFFNSYIQYLAKNAEGDIEERIASFLPKGNNITYLDCGCDDGVKTIKRAHIIGTNNILGIESENKRAQKAKKRDIKVYVADLNKKWPLKIGSIHCITATEVIEHLVNLDNFFSEARRVLIKGGKLILSTENLAGYHNIFALILGNQPYTGPYLSRRYKIGHRPCAKFYKHSLPMEPHLNVMTTKALKELLSAYEFTIVNVAPVGFYPFPPPFSRLFATIDKNHASYIVIKAVK